MVTRSRSPGRKTLSRLGSASTQSVTDLLT